MKPKLLKSKKKVKVKIQKKKPIKEIVNIQEKIEFQHFLKENIVFIKKLQYRQYAGWAELSKIRDTLIYFFNNNKFFKEYCKNHGISSYLLPRTSSEDVKIK